jgi:hypothetical protein
MWKTCLRFERFISIAAVFALNKIFFDQSKNLVLKKSIPEFLTDF